MTFPARMSAAAVGLVSAAAIGVALVFEYGLGLAPCPLCLLQRKPYYLAAVIGLLGAALPLGPRAIRMVLLALAALFLFAAGAAAYHAGVEWGWWVGPSDCSGAVAGPSDINGFLESLGKARVVSCSEAAWRFLGLSLAGWNAVLAAGLFAASAWAAWRHRNPSAAASDPFQ